MSTDKEQIKKKICEKLPDLLPKLFKTVIVHIVMMIYHISMPPWVIALKAKKGLKSYQSTNEQNKNEQYTEAEPETDSRIMRRKMRRLNRRQRRL